MPPAREPVPTTLRYDGLSNAALKTVVEIALPNACGLSYSEIAEQLGVPKYVLTHRMAALRRELRLLDWEEGP